MTKPASEPSTEPISDSKRKRVLILSVKIGGVVAAIWLLAAYVLLPALWKHYEHHPVLEDAPKTTLTAQGIPGDPLNVGFIGSEATFTEAMLKIGWHPADPVTLRSSIKIASSVVFDRAYVAAPVSDLFLFGRKQDLAFEKPAGKSASHRHHVRFWKAAELGGEDFPLWIGAITYDQSVGLSRTTGQITHHISADVDAERDLLVNELSKAGWLTEVYQVTGVGATMLGRNGGGDPYFTDGELSVGVLAGAGSPNVIPKHLENPAPVQIKEQLWAAIRPLLKSLPGNEPVE